MFLPYRAKNPPEKTPYVTIALIAVNTIVFLLTIGPDCQIRESVLQAAGISHNSLSFTRLITSIFIHENILHIGGNMLFLWIFGAAVEGRIGHWKYACLYFFAGLTGGLLSDLVEGISHPDVMSLGASGAIMGLAGAYMYLFPYSIICIFRWWMFRIWISEWHARWVVLYYVGLDVLSGVLFGGRDGVGHFAHIGGFATGLLCMFALGAHRDNEQYSSVQAVRAENVDISDLRLADLDTLLQKPNPDANLILTYIEKSMATGETRNQEKALQNLTQHARILIEQGDAPRLAEVIVRMTPDLAQRVPTVLLLRLGSRLERLHANEPAVQMYYMIKDLSPNSPDCEVALYRMGRLAENVYQAPDQARDFYQEILKRFPSGTMALEAQRALAGISARASLAPGTNNAG